MIAILIFIGLFSSAAYFKSRMDLIMKDPDYIKDDWKGKWKLGEVFKQPIPYKGRKQHWWYLGLYKPKYIEKRPFSSTALVFLTDDWHLNQWCFLRVMYIIITSQMDVNSNWFKLVIVFVILPILFGIPFEIFYKKLKLKK